MAITFATAETNVGDPFKVNVDDLVDTIEKGTRSAVALRLRRITSYARLQGNDRDVHCAFFYAYTRAWNAIDTRRMFIESNFPCHSNTEVEAEAYDREEATINQLVDDIDNWHKTVVAPTLATRPFNVSA
jgi:hypothetical protein